MPFDNASPKVNITHITTDENGRTVTRQLPISDLSLRRTIETSPALWATEPSADTLSRSIWVMPPDWDGGWHTNPRRQLVVPLSGYWWVRTQDGIRTVLGPGEASLGDDLNAVADESGHIGHDSGVEGSEPVVLLMIALADNARR